MTLRSNLKKENVGIGTAGWGMPSLLRNNFPAGESLLERYSRVFNFVEINSSFYRSHLKKTYAKWAANTPYDFRFSVKMAKEITHTKKLVNVDLQVSQFIEEVNSLESKLGVILIQLPPSLKFDAKIATDFFMSVRSCFTGNIALEARHISWAATEAYKVYRKYRIVQVMADPKRIPTQIYKLQEFQYYRLHGSPKIYASSYEESFLAELAASLTPSSFVIFDNTQFGAATQNALDLKSLIMNKEI